MENGLPAADRRRALSGGVLELGIEDILKILPHRPSMLLVDRVVALVPGEHAVGFKNVTGNEYGLASRRHGFVFPSTFALEALAQLAMLAALYDDAGEDRKPVQRRPYGLGAVHLLQVEQELWSGDRLYLTVSLTSLSEGCYTVHGEAEAGGKLFVRAAFELKQFPEPPAPGEK